MYRNLEGLYGIILKFIQIMLGTLSIVLYCDEGEIKVYFNVSNIVFIF